MEKDMERHRVVDELSSEPTFNRAEDDPADFDEGFSQHQGFEREQSNQPQKSSNDLQFSKRTHTKKRQVSLVNLKDKTLYTCGNPIDAENNSQNGGCANDPYILVQDENDDETRKANLSLKQRFLTDLTNIL